MNIETIATILMGMRSTLDLIKDEPELKRVIVSRYFHTSNDLVFADIQLALDEVLEGILAVQEIELEKEVARQVNESL